MRLNAELTALLATAGVGEPHRPPRRHRLIVVQNFGAVPTGEGGAANPIGARGFNLIVLSEDGVPSHFCKCRDAADESLIRENELLARLSQDPGVRDIIPPTSTACAAGLRIQVQPRSRAATFARAARGMALPSWTRALDAILRNAELVCHHAAIAAPELSAGEPDMDLPAAAAEALNYLAARLLTRDQAAALEGLLARTGRVPRRIQHGRLWPANVVLARGGPQLLEFELLGRVQVPLFDACHLVRTSMDLWRIGDSVPAHHWWLDAMADDECPVAGAARAVLAQVAERSGLDSRQAVGALVFYVVEMAARIHRRRGYQVHWEPFVSEARRIADAVRAGGLLDWVFFGRS